MVFKPQSFHEMPARAEIDHPSDASLEAEVAATVARSGHFDASRITVTVAGTTVTLSGFVGSQAEMDAAGDTAARVPGVDRVDNRLMIQAAAT